MENIMIEEEMRLVKLFTPVSGEFIEKLIYTNASDYVIKHICEEIEEDGILSNINKINGVLEVLKARGYKYKTVDNISQFGL